MILIRNKGLDLISNIVNKHKAYKFPNRYIYDSHVPILVRKQPLDMIAPYNERCVLQQWRFIHSFQSTQQCSITPCPTQNHKRNQLPAYQTTEISGGTAYPKAVPVILETPIDEIVCCEFEKLGP